MDALDEQSKTSASVEFKFVSLCPSHQSSIPSPELGNVLQVLAIEKRDWTGINSSITGVPLGIREAHPQDLDSKVRQLLQSFNPDSKPPLIRFFPVKESQLIKDGLPINLYAKANYLQSQELVYRLHKAEGKLVRSILELAGFYATDSHDWNILWAGSAPQSYHFDGLHEYQKINHFPASTELTRKDNLCSNIVKMQERFGKQAFDFIPETFILPSEFADFFDRFQASPELLWIAKPSASSQGRGIFLVESISQVPLEDSYILSRYISDPFLVNGLKFDMRIYVLVTSYHPLRVYVYSEGLARFASEEYTPLARKDAKYIHLTNYSINKKNEHFVQNQDYKKDNIGHKWSLSALFKHLSEMGIDTDFLWSKIYDLIIKSVISIEDLVVESVQDLGLHRNNCFDLFGFDVLLDSALKPWLLEVNLSPSLATDSPLDLYIKSNLIADTFNLVGIRAFDRRKEALSKVRARLRAKRSTNTKSTHSKPGKTEPAKTKDIIRDSLEEMQRRGRFICIYPNQAASVYDPYFRESRTLNRCIYGLLYSSEGLTPSLSVGRMASEPLVHLSNDKSESYYGDRRRTKARLSSSVSKDKSLCVVSATGVHLQTRQEKIVITGDDILLEYVHRLTNAVGRLQEEHIHPEWKQGIEAFVSHPVWKTRDPSLLTTEGLGQRLQGRYEEMRERRLHMQEAQTRHTSPSFKQETLLEDQRNAVISGFSARQLEDMLRASTKNLAREVVLPLLENPGGGVLSSLLAMPQPASTSALEEEQGESGSTELFRRSSLVHQKMLPKVLRTSWQYVSKRPKSTIKATRTNV